MTAAKQPKVDISRDITLEEVKQVLRDHMEDIETPTKVLEVFSAHAGKRLTKHLLKHLPGGAEEWRIVKEFGMTKLEQWSYRRSNVGFHFYLSHDTVDVMIDPVALQERNQGYFRIRQRDNTQRLAMLADPVALQVMVDNINATRRLRNALAMSEHNLGLLTSDLFSADRYDWERLAGKE